MAGLPDESFEQWYMDRRTGRWTVIEECDDHVAVRLSASYCAGAIVGMIIIAIVGTGFVSSLVEQDTPHMQGVLLIPVLACVGGMWRMVRQLRRSLRRPTLLRICDQAPVSGQEPAIDARGIQRIEVIENWLRHEDDDDLVQLWAICGEEAGRFLLYQSYRKHRPRVEELGRRLATRWDKPFVCSVTP